MMKTFGQHALARVQVITARLRARYAEPTGMGHTGSNVGWIIGIVIVLTLVILTLIPTVNKWATTQFTSLTGL
jgi:hypothetical protein